jgi:ligand-binding SRPBCC domain-containing protein
MMQQFQTDIFIQSPPRVVYEYLSQPNNMVGLSPLIVRVDNITSEQSNAITIVRYTSVERFLFFGFIRYDNHIRIECSLEIPNQRLVNRVKSPLNVSVEFVNVLTPEKGGTRLTETVTLHAPFWLLWFAVSEAKRTQSIRFERLKGRIEALAGQ